MDQGLASAGRIASIVLLLSVAAFPRIPAAEPVPQRDGTNLLRVCADPNNLPFSNAKEEGFENRLAQLVAKALGQTVQYTWWAQRRGFIRNTLKAGTCDVILGTPALDMIDTTKPYYSSDYVFVSRAADQMTFTSIEAPELRHLRVGVQLIGDDGTNTPPAHALGLQRIVDNVTGYTVYGDYAEDSPPSRIVKAVATGEIDVAAVWGPLAGFYASRSSVPLRVVRITDTEKYRPLAFRFPIAMGVRKGDDDMKRRLDQVISQHREEISELLKEFGVPLD